MQVCMLFFLAHQIALCACSVTLPAFWKCQMSAFVCSANDNFAYKTGFLSFSGLKFVMGLYLGKGYNPYECHYNLMRNKDLNSYGKCFFSDPWKMNESESKLNIGKDILETKIQLVHP